MTFACASLYTTRVEAIGPQPCLNKRRIGARHRPELVPRGASTRRVSRQVLFRRHPDGVDDESACFAYLPTLGTHALRLAGYQPGEFVAIVGQGIIGQTAGLGERSGFRAY